MNEHEHIPPARDFPSGRLQQRKEQLVSALNLQGETRMRRRRRVVLVLVPAVIALLVATGFTTYALTREPTHFESIGCFETPDLDGNTAIVGADGRDPAAICAEVWQEGGFGAAPVPRQLTACVLATGGVGVFPSSGPGTCGRLGIANLPASYAVEGGRFVELRDAILAHFGEPDSGTSSGRSKCVGEEAARAAVRRELDAHGYGDWGIEVAEGSGGFTSERPCAEIGFDGGRKLVVLVPTRR